MRLTGACAQSTGVLIAAWDHGLPTPMGQFGGLSIAHRYAITAIVPFATNGSSGLDGSGSWSLTYTVPAYKAGRTYHYAAFVDDPAAPGWRSMSTELVVTYGF